MAGKTRPEFTAVWVAALLVAATVLLRIQVIRMGQEETSRECRVIGELFRDRIEDYLERRASALAEFGQKLAEASDPAKLFLDLGGQYEKFFSGKLAFVPADTNGSPAPVWLNPHEPGSLEWEYLAEKERTNPNKKAVLLLAGEEGLRYREGSSIYLLLGLEEAGSVVWSFSFPRTIEEFSKGVPSEGCSVFLIVPEGRIPLQGQEIMNLDFPPIFVNAFLPGQSWKIEVRPSPRLIESRYGFFSNIVLVVGLFVAVGAGFATFLWRRRSASLREISFRDELTGMRNRRAFNDLLERELAISERYGRPLSMFIIDLDHFKRINDTMGHGVGDQVLQQAADTIQRAIRETDVAFRHGGEEFAVILAETDLVAASGVAERVRLSFRDHTFHTSKGAIQLTASIGVTGYRTGESADQFLTRSDLALYRAKSEGRDRVVIERPAGWDA